MGAYRKGPAIEVKFIDLLGPRGPFMGSTPCGKV